MAGEQEIASTGALEKYLTRIQKQVRQLGLMKANPILNAVDLITGKIDAIGVRFEQMTSKMKMLSIDISMKPNWSNFEQAGTEAGKVFTDAFIAAFDSDKLAQKAKKSLESIEVNVNLGSSGGGGDFVEDVGKGALSNILSDIVIGVGKGGYNRVKKKLNYRKKKIDDLTNPESMQDVVGNNRPRSQKHGVRNRFFSTLLGNRVRVPPHLRAKNTTFGRLKDFGKSLWSGLNKNSNNMFSLMGAAPVGMLGNALMPNPLPAGKSMDLLPAGKPADLMRAKSLGKSALKLTGKLFRPLGLISDAMAITGAETVEERNKAIGSAVGGWGGAAAGAAAGAAIGSVVPVIGTAIGGLVGGAIGGLGGSAVGEFVGGKAKEATNKIKGWFGFGKKKKKEEDPVSLPAPPEPKPVALPSPTVTNPLVSPFSQVPATPPAMPINVNVPYGAIQITVHNPDIDYEQISAQIGSRFATSIQQAMENRA